MSIDTTVRLILLGTVIVWLLILAGVFAFFKWKKNNVKLPGQGDVARCRHGIARSVKCGQCFSETEAFFRQVDPVPIGAPPDKPRTATEIIQNRKAWMARQIERWPTPFAPALNSMITSNASLTGFNSSRFYVMGPPMVHSYACTFSEPCDDCKRSK